MSVAVKPDDTETLCQQTSLENEKPIQTWEDESSAKKHGDEIHNLIKKLTRWKL